MTISAHMGVKHKAYSAIRWTGAAAVARAGVQLLQVALIARLLAPEDYGLMAMVTVVLSYAGIFSDLGVNSAFVQKQAVSEEERSSLFWFNLLTSVCVTIVIVFISPFVASFFGDARLTHLIMLSAVTFVLVALGAQNRVVLSKELDFRPLAIQEITVAILGLVIAVLGAVAGWGVYALVVSSIMSSAVGAILTWVFLSREWHPMWRLKMEEITPFLGFGGAFVANSFVNQMNACIDIFLGGRLLAASQLGLYSVPRNLALQVQMMVNPIVTRVGFPLIAKVQCDVERVKSIYLKTINMVASTNAPIYMGIVFFAPEFVTVLLGSKWNSSGELLRIFAVWGAIRSLGNPMGCMVQGMGRADLALKWNVGLFVIAVPSLYWGSQYGVKGLAWAMLFVQCLLFVPGWYFMIRTLCCAGLQEYVIVALKPFLLALVAFVPAYGLAMHFDLTLARLTAGIVIALPLYVLVSYRFNAEWWEAITGLVLRKQ